MQTSPINDQIPNLQTDRSVGWVCDSLPIAGQKFDSAIIARDLKQVIRAKILVGLQPPHSNYLGVFFSTLAKLHYICIHWYLHDFMLFDYTYNLILQTGQSPNSADNRRSTVYIERYIPEVGMKTI